MNAVTALRAADLIDAPFDGMERYILKGKLRESPVGARDRATGKLLPAMPISHSIAMTATIAALGDWLDSRPQPRCAVLSGGVGWQHGDSTFGVDAMVVAAEVLAAQTGESTIVEGVPTLCVEILSPSEVIERIDEKTDAYRAAGVPLVWLLDLHDKSVTVYRPGAEPEFSNRLMELTAEPHLPGFRVKVADLFG